MSCCCEDHIHAEHPQLSGKCGHQRFGFSISSQGKKIDEILETSASFGCFTCQFFLGSPMSYNCKDVTSKERKKAKEFCNDNNCTYYVHIPYFANLARRTDDPKGEWILEKSKELVSKNLHEIRGQPGACILHTGTMGSIENLANNINELNVKSGKHEKMPVQLLLEPPAGEGSKLVKTWKECRHLYEALDQTTVGLCLDTAHLFASGMCSFNSHESVVRLFDKAENYPLRVFHMNDSQVDFREHKDRHAPISEGYIWNCKKSGKIGSEKDGKVLIDFFRQNEGLGTLLDRCKEKNYDMISETSNGIRDNYIVNRWYELSETGKLDI